VSPESLKLYTKNFSVECRSLQSLKYIKVRRVEARADDAWYDITLRQLRRGEVSFYRVKDLLTGEWLFKLCKDKEQGKILVKAVKCPAGIRFSQLEGRTMVFQQSNVEDMLYDVISLSQADENDKVSRDIVSNIEEVPAIIKENYTVKSYEEATGKKAPGKHLVTLSKRDDEKELVTLFVLERAWALSKSTLEEKLEAKKQKTKATKKEVDTGDVWLCPICGKKHRLVHVETEKTVKHALRKPHSE
jgi:rubrerythrin